MKRNNLNLLGASAVHLAVCLLVDHLMPESGPKLALIGAIAAAAAPALINAVAGGGKKKFSQGPLRTPEQIAAQQKLLSFGQTGEFNGQKAGEKVDIKYGDTQQTQAEQTGSGTLQSLLDSGVPEQFKQGSGALQDFLQTSPEAIENLFNPMKERSERLKGEAVDSLKRNSAFAGNLYSTDTIEGLGDIEARSNESLQSNLAGLIDQERGRKLQAAGLSFQGAETGQALGLGQVKASQDFGGQVRDLNNAGAAERNQELLRRRQEGWKPLDALKTVAGASAEFGVESVSPSPYAGLISKLGGVAGDYLQKKSGSIDKAIGAGFGKMFGGSAKQPPFQGTAQQAALTGFNV